MINDNYWLLINIGHTYFLSSKSIY